MQTRAEGSATGAALAPLCVDLDGTLLRSDSLYECLAAALRRPWLLLRLPLWLLRGKASFKAEISKRVTLNSAALPFHNGVLQLLHNARGNGRKIVLATGADRKIAMQTATHLAIFDEVIASDGVHNLSGEGKAEVLRARFGAYRFSYVGNARSDIAIWRSASSAVIVGMSRRQANRIAAFTSVEAHLPRGSRIRSFIRLLRPYQWCKNLLVFVPIVTANALSDRTAWIRCAGLFVALSLMASVLYVFNDIVDLESDRLHPIKRKRPLASGDFPLSLSFGAVPVGLAAAIAIAVALKVLPEVLLYGIASFVYSIGLKRFPLVDLFLLAAIYSVRLLAGGVVSGHFVSFWLFSFSCFLFFSLATIKRVSELLLLQEQARVNSSRGYRPGDIFTLQAMGISSSFVSCLVLALYVQSPTVTQNYRSPELLWAQVVLILFWQCRLWLSTIRGHIHDDPIVFAGKDWVSWLVAVLILLAMLLANSNLSKLVSP
ncbi:MAG: UbiA family prenyltransferase [Acidobacteriia bacterium]|nr:UbiA family prenyltransferase [Terriglobia bacterium]